MTKAVWALRAADERTVRELVDSGVREITARLLASRGVEDASEAQRFLNPSLESLAPATGLPDIDTASELIVRAIRDKRHICIYGDFDADGITSTALAVEFFKSLGIECSYYIPDRELEGYGISREGIAKIAESGAKLLITADCGTTNADEVDYARSLGLDVVVSDHHRPLGELPDCPFVNPILPGSTYPFRHLAGVGVMIYLLGAVRKRLVREGLFGSSDVPDLRRSLDLVALGTVADVVPLVGENRILAHFGLELLTNSQRTGIVALKDVSGLKNKRLNAYHISFVLAPRINAAGRLETADIAVELLLTRSPSEAIELARRLNELNSRRQQIESRIYERAKAVIAEDPDWESRYSFVIAQDGWHPGVIGIVASKLCQEYHRPVFLIALDGDTGRGSGRSIEDVDLMKALDACRDLIETFGGHSQAAGLKIRRDRTFEFAQAFEQAVKEQLGERMPTPTLWIDAYVEPEQLTVELAREIERFEPTGIGNPEPTLAIKSCPVESKELRKDRHLKLMVSFDRFRFEALWWNHGHYINRIGRYADIAFVPEIDRYWGEHVVRWKVKAMKPSAEG